MMGFEASSERTMNPSSRRLAVELITLAWPLIVSMMLLYLDSANTRFWLGRFYGKDGLAVHTTTAPVINLVYLLFIAVSTGCGVAVARSIGARDGRGLSIAASAAALSVVMWIVVAAVMVSCATPLAELLAKQDVSPVLVRTFLVPWILLTMPVFALVGLLVATASGAGWTRFALRQGAIHLALATGLVPLFLGPLDLGYYGPPLALAVASAINCVLLWRMLRREAVARFTTDHIDRTLMFQGRVWRELLEVGLPVQLSRAGSYAVILAAVLKVGHDGAATLAGFGISMAYIEIVGAVSGGNSRASQIKIAQRLGAKDITGARRVLAVSLWISLGLALISCLALFALAPLAVAVFTDNSEVIEAGVRSLHLIVWALLPAAMFQLLIGAFAAAKAAKRAFVLALVAQALALLVGWQWTGDRVLGATVSIFTMYGLCTIFYFALSVPVLWRGVLRADDQSAA